jgi:hypothetical protein
MTSPETLAAMLTDNELRQRIAELEEDLRHYAESLDTANAHTPHADGSLALRVALRVLRAEQVRRA